MKKIAPSELVLNPDGSIYHLNLKPENVADTIIFVGDQDRVAKVSKHFDTIEFETQKREFKTITGTLNKKRISVISTGIGPDNIDIVINELDALFNIDLKNRKIKSDHTALNIVRIGTSGSLQAYIPVDSFVLATHGLGMDGLLHSYKCDGILEHEMANEFVKHCHWNLKKGMPYFVKNSSKLEEKLMSDSVFGGITATADGFYGPQGRTLRLELKNPNLNNLLETFNYNGHQVTNFEMETSAIYGLSKLLGHHACSLNAIIANRPNQTFSKDTGLVIQNLIEYTLKMLTL